MMDFSPLPWGEGGESSEPGEGFLPTESRHFGILVEASFLYFSSVRQRPAPSSAMACGQPVSKMATPYHNILSEGKLMYSKTNSHFLQETKRQPVRGLKKIVRAAVSVLILYLAALPTRAPATDYSTKFPKAEALISEGGHWITAGTPGVNWHDTLCGDHGDLHVSSVSTTPGYAFGPSGPERFGDALALLTGNWKPDQMAEATVRLVDPVRYPEVEIRLRTSPKDATGYEIMWSALGKKKTAYLSIATWNGPGSKPPHYTIIKSLKGPEYGVTTGDVVKGMIVGHTITAYCNGRLQFKITDSTFVTGNPGFGLNEGPNGTYGISSFTATDRVPGK